MPAAAFKAVIFDMDGTLLDTLEDLADCMNRVLERHGLPPHPVGAYRYFVGDGVDKLVSRSLPEERRDGPTVQRIKAEMQAEYGVHWADKTRPYDGILELLDELAARGLPVAILSNKPDAFTRAIAERYFAGRRFAQVVGARDDAPRKPNPAAALEIAGALGVEPGKVLYLGDTNTDMQTARRAGMFALGVLWGFRPKEELLESGAQDTVQRPEEVLRFLGG
jgi:phosphoglycolate phosphatase